jgi:hypothetical protein
LDGDRALDRIHRAWEFGENAVASSVDDTPAKFDNHWKDGSLMPFEITYRARFIGARKSAIPSDVCGQDGH